MAPQPPQGTDFPRPAPLYPCGKPKAEGTDQQYLEQDLEIASVFHNALRLSNTNASDDEKSPSPHTSDMDKDELSERGSSQDNDRGGGGLARLLESPDFLKNLGGVFIDSSEGEQSPSPHSSDMSEEQPSKPNSPFCCKRSPTETLGKRKRGAASDEEDESTPSQKFKILITPPPESPGPTPAFSSSSPFFLPSPHQLGVAPPQQSAQIPHFDLSQIDEE